MTDAGRLEEGERLYERVFGQHETGSVHQDLRTWLVDNFPWMRDVIRAAASVLKGVDEWNESVQEVIGHVPDYKWGDLERLRSLLSAEKKPNPQSCPTCGGVKNHRPGCQDTWAAFEEMGG